MISNPGVGMVPLGAELLEYIRSLYEPLSEYDSSSGAALEVKLDCGESSMARLVEVWVKSSAKAIFDIQVSSDDSVWRNQGRIRLIKAGEKIRGYFNAWRYIKVLTNDMNNNEIEIIAAPI